MDNGTRLLLSRDIQGITRKIQRSFFEIIDDIKASDQDNYTDLIGLLKDETLARKFLIFQENRNKVIRKKILDCTGDLQRELEDVVGCVEQDKTKIEYTGIMKK